MYYVEFDRKSFHLIGDTGISCIHVACTRLILITYSICCRMFYSSSLSPYVPFRITNSNEPCYSVLIQLTHYRARAIAHRTYYCQFRINTRKAPKTISPSMLCAVRDVEWTANNCPLIFCCCCSTLLSNIFLSSPWLVCPCSAFTL